MVLTTEISVFPNPFDHFVILEVTCEEAVDCIILLADLEPGRIIRMMGAGLKNGINRLPPPVNTSWISKPSPEIPFIRPC